MCGEFLNVFCVIKAKQITEINNYDIAHTHWHVIQEYYRAVFLKYC